MANPPVTASANLRGIVLMVLAVGVILLNDAVTKLLTEHHGLGQIILLRQIAAALPILAYVHWGTGWGALVPGSWTGQLTRGFFLVISVWLMVLSVSLLPLPTVTAIAFASPLLIAALSVPILGETVGWRRGLATLAGFAGVLVIVRPGTAAFDWALLVPVAAALTIAFRDLLTRRLSRTDTSIAILFWSSVFIIVTSLPVLAFGGWTPVPAYDAGLFVLAGLLNTGAHFLMIEALRHGQAAVVAPFRYSALLWSVLLGFMIWGDLPSWWTLLGASILIASGIYMMRNRD